MIKASDLSITIVFDNYPYRDDLKTLWGFSCYIETPENTLLFDTGSNGRVLLENMKKTGSDVKKVDTLFLSHHHWDHIGGFDSVIELNPDVDIFAPSSLSRLLVKDLRSMVRSVSVADEKSTMICPDIYTTGMMGEDVEEQSIIIDTDIGAVVITGCAHSGIVEIAKRAGSILGKKIALLLGGFHLMRKDIEEIDEVVGGLMCLDIDHIAPTHCTGDLAMERLHKAFGKRAMVVGVGKRVELPQE